MDKVFLDIICAVLHSPGDELREALAREVEAPRVGVARPGLAAALRAGDPWSVRHGELRCGSEPVLHLSHLSRRRWPRCSICGVRGGSHLDADQGSWHC